MLKRSKDGKNGELRGVLFIDKTVERFNGDK